MRVVARAERLRDCVAVAQGERVLKRVVGRPDGERVSVRDTDPVRDPERVRVRDPVRDTDLVRVTETVRDLEEIEDLVAVVVWPAA